MRMSTNEWGCVWPAYLGLCFATPLLQAMCGLPGYGPDLYIFIKVPSDDLERQLQLEATRLDALSFLPALTRLWLYLSKFTVRSGYSWSTLFRQ